MNLINEKNKKLSIFLFVLLILFMAVSLRFWNLGKFGFWTDELFHTIAAKSLIEEGNTYVPAKGNYFRAIPYTYFVMYSFKLFGINEFTARIPSVLFNMIFIFLGYFMIRRFFNHGVAILFVIVMAFSPFAITMSRECRMYTLFQLLYLLMSIFFFIGIENKNGKVMFLKKIESKYEISLCYLLASLILFIFSIYIHHLTFNIVFPVSSYSLILLFYVFRNEGLYKGLHSKYFIILMLIASSFLFLYVFRQDYVNNILESARSIPVWASYKLTDFQYYRHFLSDNYPALFFVYPLSIIFMIKREGKKGLFIFLSFFVLFIMHSFVFGRKADRYIFYIYPFFVLGSVYFIYEIICFVVNEINRQFKNVSIITFSVVVLLALLSFNVIGYPWLGNSRKVVRDYNHPDWKTIPEDVKEDILKGKAMSSRHTAFYWYFKDSPDCLVNASSVSRKIKHNKHLIKVVNDIKSLKYYFANNQNSLYVVENTWSFNNDAYYSKEMREFILENTIPVFHSGDKSIIIKKRKPASSVESMSNLKLW